MDGGFLRRRCALALKTGALGFVPASDRRRRETGAYVAVGFQPQFLNHFAVDFAVSAS